ncbi:MAG: hypothetical protein RQ748_01115 [Elusimicrobiales bacterium]|nr:hypothetical protein [Elusimicrobiales bacterium]
MTKIIRRTFLITVLASVSSGCASFQSGDVRVDRNDLRDMLKTRRSSLFRRSGSPGPIIPISTPPN